MRIEQLERRDPAFAFSFVVDSLEEATGVRVDFEFDIDEQSQLVSLVDWSYATFEEGSPDPIFLRQAGVDVELAAADADAAFEDFEAVVTVGSQDGDITATLTQTTPNSNVDLVLAGDDWDGNAGAVNGDLVEVDLENEVLIEPPGTSGIRNAAEAFLLEQNLRAAFVGE